VHGAVFEGEQARLTATRTDGFRLRGLGPHRRPFRFRIRHSGILHVVSESPDFDQIAQVIAMTIPSVVTRELVERDISQQLRQVWNARGASDRAVINGEFMRGADPEFVDAMAKADVYVELHLEELLKALDSLPCECGCGRFSQGGHLEGAHPEDYRAERG
jgi:hypothetical protein